jgi:3-deoxy-D-manno-octulosonic-acid transferase
MTHEPNHSRPIGHRVARLFYRAAWWFLTPGLGPYLRHRAKRGKEDLARLDERFGLSHIARGDGPVIWIHGASVGESLSALPVIEQIVSTNPQIRVLVTSGTVTSAQVLAARLPSGALHQYIPLDHPAYVKRFLAHWQPSAVLWLESEFWPNLIVQAAKKKIPMALVNARLSDTSFRTWRKNRWAIEPILKSFQLSLAQDANVAQKLTALGASNVATIGNLKYAGAQLPFDPVQLETFAKSIGDRPIWIAAQTISPEEEMVVRAHIHLRETFPGLLTVIAPRHPERSEEIVAILEREDLNVAVRSKGEAVRSETDIYLADTMGELGLFYRLARTVFLGRSLVPLGGGSNLLEPTRLGCAVVQGPYTENFKEISDRFVEANAVIVVEDERGLIEALAKMLGNPAQAEEVGQNAQSLANEAASVLDKVIDAVGPLLPKPGGDDARA